MNRSLVSLVAFCVLWLAWAPARASDHPNAPQPSAAAPAASQVWPSQPPEGCPLETSKSLVGILFTGAP